MPEVIEAQTFGDCVRSLKRDDPRLADLMQKLIELRIQPFHNPKPSTHTVSKASNAKAVFPSDVCRRAVDRRLVWQKFGETIVVLRCGTRAADDRAEPQLPVDVLGIYLFLPEGR